MIEIKEIILQLTRNAEVLRVLVQTISDEQAKWKPDPEIWSINEVMEHLYNEERIDFRKHLKEMLSDPPQPWGEFRREEYVSVKDCRLALEGFLHEREDSIAWLKVLKSLESIRNSGYWDTKSPAPFDPLNGDIILSAGDVLVSWVAHDFLHIRQINELLFAWNVKQASPYLVDYAGGW
jgi:hypothetical protein